MHPHISAKVRNVALSQFSEIIRWQNNRMSRTSVQRWLANACGIFSGSIEQLAQRGNLNMGLVAK